jgi:hypothetical protein
VLGRKTKKGASQGMREQEFKAHKSCITLPPAPQALKKMPTTQTPNLFFCCRPYKLTNKTVT